MNLFKSSHLPTFPPPLCTSAYVRVCNLISIGGGKVGGGKGIETWTDLEAAWEVRLDRFAATCRRKRRAK